MSDSGIFSPLERAAAMIDTYYDDGDGTDQEKEETINGSDTIPAGSSPNQNGEGEGASADAMGAAPALEHIEPCITYQHDDDDDDFVYPTDEDADRYKAAAKAHSNAIPAQLSADDHSTLCWRAKNKLDSQLRPLEQTAQRSKAELEEVRASIPELDEATRKCEDMLACIREVHPKACSSLLQKQAALVRAEAGCEVDGKRKRSATGNRGTFASKSVKVGAESAGKAARSGRPISVSIPAVYDPDSPAEKRLDKLRVGVETAEKDVRNTEASIDEVLQLLKDHRSHAAGERTRVEPLTRAAADDAQALHAFSVSLCYREACEAYHDAGVELEEAKTAAILAEGELRAAEAVFREAFIAGKCRVTPSQRLETAKAEIARKMMKPYKGKIYPRFDCNLVVPEPTAHIRLPELEGIHATKESKMGIDIAKAVGEFKRARARRQALESKMGAKVAEKEESGEQERVKARPQAKKATPAVGGATVRRSTRSSRGQPAKVYGQ